MNETTSNNMNEINPLRLFLTEVSSDPLYFI